VNANDDQHDLKDHKHHSIEEPAPSKQKLLLQGDPQQQLEGWFRSLLK